MYAKIISIADEFANLVVKKKSGKQYSTDEAIHHLMNVKRDLFEDQLLDTFGSLFEYSGGFEE